MSLYANKKLVSFIVSVLISSGLACAQYGLNNNESLKGVILNFRCNDYRIDSLFSDNRMTLQRIDTFLNSKNNISSLDSIIIQAGASPEGRQEYNNWLAKQRSITVKEYLLNKYNCINKIPVKTISVSEKWSALIELMERDSMCPDRIKVIEILNEDLSSEEKENRIKSVSNGAPWQYIKTHMLDDLRGASCLVFKLKRSALSDIASKPLALIKPAPHIFETEIYADTILDIKGLNDHDLYIRPVALKTNLLFDLLSLTNIEIEVPVHKHFSIAAEWIFPWWLSNRKQNCIEILSGSLECRYWFDALYSKQEDVLLRHNPLTGFFAGVYGGGGLYDLEWNKNGYQGEFYKNIGITGGYSYPLSKNINIEFSIGVGFLQTKYRHYHASHCDIHNKWHLIRQNTGTFSWFGPTKAKVSFVWYPHFKIKR